MALIEVDALYKLFGTRTDEALDLLDDGAAKDEVRDATGVVTAVRDATFKVETGEVFVIMGLSGSGKSTLLRCLNRLVEPTRGTIRVHGDNILAASEDRLRALRRTTMSMVFQHFGLLPHRTVQGNVEYGLEVSGMPADERREKARSVLARVGLEATADDRISELSGGMQQRVGLARALATDPEILLMDEPFSALDPLIRAELQDELLDLQAELQQTIVFITHDLDEALKMGDRIAIMREGAIVQVGPPEEILLTPATDYVRAFVQNVDRTKVLRVRALTRDPTPEEQVAAETSATVRADAVVADVLPHLLAAEGPVPVQSDDGAVVGVVDRAAVLRALSGDGAADTALESAAASVREQA